MAFCIGFLSGMVFTVIVLGIYSCAAIKGKSDKLDDELELLEKSNKN